MGPTGSLAHWYVKERLDEDYLLIQLSPPPPPPQLFEKDPDSEAKEAAQGDLDYEVIDPIKKSREIQHGRQLERGHRHHSSKR